MGTATSNARFTTTNWSLIIRARGDRAAMEELLATYWPPVYAYLRRSGRSRDEAADLTQAFIADVVLPRDIVGKADPSLGAFRSFLKAALRNFVIDTARAQSSTRSAPRTLLLDGAALDAAEPVGQSEPDAAYERQWAKSVLLTALDRVRADCLSCGMESHWHAFERRTLLPETHGSTPTIEALAAELGVQSGDVLSNMIFTVKRKLRSAIRQVVAETVASPDELEAELEALRRAMRE